MINFKSVFRRFLSSKGFSINKSRYFSLLPPADKLLVNLGAGDFYHPSWVNVDMSNDFYSSKQRLGFIPHDFSSYSPLPFDDGSVDVFYCSHVIEHLNDSSFNHLLSDTFRCLKSDGLLRITCPDADILFSAYTNSDVSYWYGLDPWGIGNTDLDYLFLEHVATILANKNRFPDFYLPSDKLNTILSSNDLTFVMSQISSLIPSSSNSLYPEGHINWFNHSKLSLAAHSHSFIFNKSSYLQSSSPYMRSLSHFDQTMPDISLYAEFIKP